MDQQNENMQALPGNKRKNESFMSNRLNNQNKKKKLFTKLMEFEYPI